MSNYQPPSNNRLLALEQELLEKKRLAQECQGKRDITDGKRNQTSRIGKKSHTNNRLLELEAEILGRYSSKKTNQKASGTYSLRVEPDNSTRRTNHKNNQLLALEQELLGQQSKPKKRRRKSKRSRVQSQVFDTGEAIVLEYNSEVFPVVTTKTEAVSPPQETLDGQEETHRRGEGRRTRHRFGGGLNRPPIENHQIADFDGGGGSLGFNAPDTELGTQSATRPVCPASPRHSVEPQPNYLQTDNIPAILAELNTNPGETPATSVSPQRSSGEDIPAKLNTNLGETSAKSVSPQPESERVQNNPHAIFDRMGKNIAYATTFDLGTIELEQLFDEFDRTLELEEQVNRGNSLSQAQGDLELKQRFDEFDRALELEEQVNRDNSLSQAQGDLELEQRFIQGRGDAGSGGHGDIVHKEIVTPPEHEGLNLLIQSGSQTLGTDVPDVSPETLITPRVFASPRLCVFFDEFDRTLEQQEKGQITTQTTPQTKSPSEIISEKTNTQIQESGYTEKEEAGEITAQIASDGIQNQNQHYVIAPLPSRQVELVQPFSHATKLHPNTSAKFYSKLQVLLFHTGINLISLILWLLNLMRRNQIPLQLDSQEETRRRGDAKTRRRGDAEKGRRGEGETRRGGEGRRTRHLCGGDLRYPSIGNHQIADFDGGGAPLGLIAPDAGLRLRTHPALRPVCPASPRHPVDVEFTGHNSYPSRDYSKVIKAENKSNPNTKNLHEKPCHPPKEGKNDSS